jgi:hypothetical protein
MRQQFCEVLSEKEAQILCAWASIIVEVEGGFGCWESVDEYETWKDQE